MAHAHYKGNLIPIEEHQLFASTSHHYPPGTFVDSHTGEIYFPEDLDPEGSYGAELYQDVSAEIGVNEGLPLHGWHEGFVEYTGLFYPQFQPYMQPILFFNVPIGFPWAPVRPRVLLLPPPREQMLLPLFLLPKNREIADQVEIVEPPVLPSVPVEENIEQVEVDFAAVEPTDRAELAVPYPDTTDGCNDAILEFTRRFNATEPDNVCKELISLCDKVERTCSVSVSSSENKRSHYRVLKLIFSSSIMNIEWLMDQLEPTNLDRYTEQVNTILSILGKLEYIIQYMQKLEQNGASKYPEFLDTNGATSLLVTIYQMKANLCVKASEVNQKLSRELLVQAKDASEALQLRLVVLKEISPQTAGSIRFDVNTSRLHSIVCRRLARHTATPPDAEFSCLEEALGDALNECSQIEELKKCSKKSVLLELALAQAKLGAAATSYQMARCAGRLSGSFSERVPQLRQLNKKYLEEARGILMDQALRLDPGHHLAIRLLAETFKKLMHSEEEGSQERRGYFQESNKWNNKYLQRCQEEKPKYLGNVQHLEAIHQSYNALTKGMHGKKRRQEKQGVRGQSEEEKQKEQLVAQWIAIYEKTDKRKVPAYMKPNYPYFLRQLGDIYREQSIFLQSCHYYQQWYEYMNYDEPNQVVCPTLCYYAFVLQKLNKQQEAFELLKGRDFGSLTSNYQKNAMQTLSESGYTHFNYHKDGNPKQALEIAVVAAKAAIREAELLRHVPGNDAYVFVRMAERCYDVHEYASRHKLNTERNFLQEAVKACQQVKDKQDQLNRKYQTDFRELYPRVLDAQILDPNLRKGQQIDLALELDRAIGQLRPQEELTRELATKCSRYKKLLAEGLIQELEKNLQINYEGRGGQKDLLDKVSGLLRGVDDEGLRQRFEQLDRDIRQANGEPPSSQRRCEEDGGGRYLKTAASDDGAASADNHRRGTKREQKPYDDRGREAAKRGKYDTAGSEDRPRERVLHSVAGFSPYLLRTLGDFMPNVNAAPADEGARSDRRKRGLEPEPGEVARGDGRHRKAPRNEVSADAASAATQPTEIDPDKVIILQSRRPIVPDGPQQLLYSAQGKPVGHSGRTRRVGNEPVSTGSSLRWPDVGGLPMDQGRG